MKLLDWHNPTRRKRFWVVLPVIVFVSLAMYLELRLPLVDAIGLDVFVALLGVQFVTVFSDYLKTVCDLAFVRRGAKSLDYTTLDSRATCGDGAKENLCRKSLKAHRCLKQTWRYLVLIPSSTFFLNAQRRLGGFLVIKLFQARIPGRQPDRQFFCRHGMADEKTLS